MAFRRSRSILITMALALGFVLTPGSPAAGETPGDSPWTGSGTATSGPAMNTRVVADGTGDSAVFAYDNLASSTGGGGASATWEFSTTASGSGTVALDYAYTGFHAFFQVRVGLEAFVDDGTTTTVTPLVAAGPINCCTTPSNGFSYEGSVSLSVTPGDTYGFRMSGSNGDLNSRLEGRLIVGAPGTVSANTLVVDGYGASRTDSPWGLTESYFATTRSYLRDPAAFGPGGTVGVDYVIGNGIDNATPQTLIGTDVFVTGWVPTGTYTPAEKQTLVDFVTGGGTLIATTDDTGHTMVDAFGLTQADGTTNPSTFLSAAHPIAAGPFGSDTEYVEYATVGNYFHLGPYATSVATNADGKTTLAEIVPGVLGAGSGLALFLSDVDFFTDFSTGAVDNEILIKNLFAYVAAPFNQPEPEVPGGAVLIQAVPNGTGDQVAIAAQVAGPPDTTRTLELLTSSTCVDGVLGGGGTLVGTLPVSIGPSGQEYVTAVVGASPVVDTYVAARMMGATSTGTASNCIVAGPDNDSWIRALTVALTPNGDGTVGADLEGFVDSLGNARWFRFAVQPGAEVRIDLTSLPEDYDLAVFKDIAQAFVDVGSTEDLDQLGAEFAPSVFSPSVFSPSVFSPSVFSPDAYAPSVFSPSVFSPSVFSPSVFSPSVFSADKYSPSVFSPSVFSPSVFSPSVFSPDEYSPSVFSPSVFSAENFASAQTRSLIAVSAQPGLGDELVIADTWNNTGFFYARVSGKNGEFDVEDSFALSIDLDGNQCSAVAPIPPAPGSPAAVTGGFETIILHDPDRGGAEIAGTPAERADLEAKLAAYAARPEVKGVIVDLGTYDHIQDLHAQADANSSCPYAENLVAEAIRDVVGEYRTLNPDLAYVTIVGSDAQVPFFRYPDQALLGPEQDYVPPVADGTQSQASLRLNYVLGQDEYGSGRSISLAEGRFPLPKLAVGRLVESASEMNTVLDAYLATTGGVVDTPASTLVTGYDFLEDAANAVQAELVAGTSGARNDTLITPGNISPQDPASWTADQLRTELLDEGEDIVFLAGHFSANSALAADYSTTALATELAASDVDLTNTIAFSAGCHSGYNIVDLDAVPGVTETTDWTNAFAQKGATLIAGTGYQYGDTDFIEYSERLYAQFAKELRRGSGPVAIGDALVRAKQQYLATTPDMRGLHRKSVLISTVFGLPNLMIDMPGDRLPAGPGGPSGITPAPVGTNPGSTLGLQTADLNVNLAGQLAEQTVALTNLSGGTLTASYLQGPDGVVTNPAEPALPLVRTNVTVTGQSLRGVGFRGGAWSEEPVVPLTGAPTTELRGVHAPFASTVNFPMRLATPNYYGSLTGTGGTSLNVTPVQHRVAQIGDIQSTRREFGSLDFRLFYSSNTTQYPVSGGGFNTPALAAPPTLTGVRATVDGDDVVFDVRVVGDPAAGIQTVWVTHTDGSASSGTWTSLDLTQSPEDSTRWRGRLVDGALAGRLDYVVQAANGVGLVTLDDNFGAYYSIQGEAAPVVAPTTLSLIAPSSASYGETVSVQATLTSEGSPVPGRNVLFSLGGSGRVATTNGSGVATVSVPVTAIPGNYTLTASFAGTEALAPSSASAPFTANKAATGITLSLEVPDPAQPESAVGVAATLKDSLGTPLLQRTVLFSVEGPDGTQVVSRITDNLGRARIGPNVVADGLFSVSAQFLGTVTTPGGATLVFDDSVYLASSASADALFGEALTVPLEPVEITTPVELTVKAPPAFDFSAVTATVDWGDGSAPEPLSSATASHLYPEAGVYQVSVTLDSGGLVTTAVSDFVVVYDPSAGFVTGGGHVWSAPGAFVDDPLVEGKATFGFVAKYKKGANVPTGNTNFQFKAADLHFQSTAYEWLVVAGNKATFRGTGTINGDGNYDFTLTGVDDDPDLFRLQIWNRDGGGLVYDTQRGDGATGQGAPLQGGSIKVHKGK